MTPYRPLPPSGKETFLLLERHRPASAIDLSPRGLRQSRRYENLVLAAAVGEMQRDCLVSTPDCEWLGRGGRQALLRTVDLSLKRLAGVVEISGRRLSHRKRVHAELRARRRFEGICFRVAVEVQGARVPVEPGPDRRPAIGSAAPSPKRAAGLPAVRALALAFPSRTLARLRSALPEGRAQTASALAAFTVVALGVGLTGWPFGASQQAGGGLGGVSAAEGAGSKSAELAALRPGAPGRSGIARSGEAAAGAHGHQFTRGANKSKAGRAGGGSPGRCNHPLDGLGPVRVAPAGPGTSGGDTSSSGGGGSTPSQPSSPPASSPTGVVNRAVTSVQSTVSNAAAQAIPPQTSSTVTSTVKHTASGVKQTVSGAAGGVLGN
jgi:hypothetical protein